MQVVIKSIKREDLISKSGKPWKSCNITVFSQTKNADVKLSGFGSSITDTWEVGDTVEVDIIDKENGYFDWRENSDTKPSPDKKLMLLQRIETKLDIIIGKLNARPQENSEIVKEIAKAFPGAEVSELGNPVVEGQIDVSQIPF